MSEYFSATELELKIADPDVALDVLDACADLPEDNPGAMLAENVVQAIGTKVASMGVRRPVEPAGREPPAYIRERQLQLIGAAHSPN